MDYLDRVQATLDPFCGKFIVQGGEPQVLEGAWAGAVIVLSFPDMTKARAWYKSAAYQNILHCPHRSSGGRRDLGRRRRPGPQARQVRGEATGSVGDPRRRKFERIRRKHQPVHQPDPSRAHYAKAFP
jgi:uncharacterized protein (DUF1330 family)